MLKTQLKATRRKQTMLKLWRCGREQWRAFAQHKKVEDEENAQPKPKITRKSGGQTIAYLREKNDGPASQAATESNAAVSADVCCYATTAVTNHFKAFRKTKLSNLNMLRAVECTTTDFIG